MYSKTTSTYRRGLASLLFIAALLSAFAAAAPDPAAKPPESPAPAVNPLQATVDTLTEQVNTGNRVLPLLQQQRNALAAQVQDYQVQLTIAQNTGTELLKQRNELKDKVADLETKYDMEKSKVEALLKSAPGGNVGVNAVVKPVPFTATPLAPEQTSAQKK